MDEGAHKSVYEIRLNVDKCESIEEEVKPPKENIPLAFAYEDISWRNDP